ncbi:MAG: protein kinase [Cyanobacteria bacterium]|nr:protein kinase [Cyanobacteriota bacterium]
MTDDLQVKAEQLKVVSTPDEVPSQESYAPDPEDASLPSLGERFELISKIGSGGMGTVYKVRERSTQELFAVKVLQDELASDQVALKRFEQEVGSTAQLSHANLVTVYEYNTTPDGAPYMVMEYIAGQSLASKLHDCGRLSVESALDLFIQIGEALDQAHQGGIVHRDLKPSNIMLSSNGTGGEIPKIVDFGIARTVNESVKNKKETITKTTEIVGSPLYMSPEQCTGGDLDAKSDIYSLGCVMFEAVTGHPPFEGSNPVQIILKQISGQTPTVVEGRSDDKKLFELDKVIRKCLSKEKSERYHSARQLVSDLKLVAAGKKVKGTTPGETGRNVSKLAMILGLFVIIWMLLFAFCIFAPVFYYASHPPPDVKLTQYPETHFFGERLNNQNRLASELQRVAFYHFRERSYTQALPLLKYVAETNKRTGHMYNEAFCYQCIGQCYLASKKYQEAYNWYKKAIDMFSAFPEQDKMVSAITETKAGYIQVLRQLGRIAEADTVQATLKKKDVRALEEFYEQSGVVEDAQRVHELLDRMQ